MPAHRQPPGLPYIVANEAAERFSYYGMKAILVVFMTTYLTGSNGQRETMSETDASFWYHIFAMGNYFFPILGGLCADIFWGKYRTIVALSIVYCIGHFALACDSTRWGLAAGLALVAIGSGGIKPCVSAHLGDQYTSQDGAGRERGFGYFYMAINLGAVVAMMLVPWILDRYGAEAAFAVPGILMGIATIVFRSGASKYRVVPPAGMVEYRKALREPDTRTALVRLAGFFAVLSIFWSLFDQTGSSWVLQAAQMDPHVAVPFIGTFAVLPAQLQAINPFVVIVLVPLFSFLVYPAVERHMTLTTQTKIVAGMFVASAAFLVVAYAQHLIQLGERPTVLWQAAAYLILTTAEVLVSVTSLEFAYTHAPQRAKSLAMGMYFLSVAFGNGVTALASGWLSATGVGFNVAYFLIFAGLSAAAGIVLAVVLRTAECNDLVR